MQYKRNTVSSLIREGIIDSCTHLQHVWALMVIWKFLCCILVPKRTAGNTLLTRMVTIQPGGSSSSQPMIVKAIQYHMIHLSETMQAAPCMEAPACCFFTHFIQAFPLWFSKSTDQQQKKVSLDSEEMLKRQNNSHNSCCFCTFMYVPMCWCEE